MCLAVVPARTHKYPLQEKTVSKLKPLLEEMAGIIMNTTGLSTVTAQADAHRCTQLHN